VKVYATMSQRMTLAETGEYARRVEGLGYDGLLIPEGIHDGLLLSLAALQATTTLNVWTCVLVAFPRSPMIIAGAAWDLQSFSGGRFTLGLGAQVKGNIVGRYSTPWVAPVARMREYVGSLRAIFDCWQGRAPLAFEGEHYRFTRMQPFFNPGPIEHPEIPIFLGGVEPAMTALAGEVATGLMPHPTNSSPRYLREVVLPRLAKGANKVGRSPDSVLLVSLSFVITGRSRKEMQREREEVRQYFGFLYSTPAYWPTLDLYGWGELGRELLRLSRENRWAEMTPLIRDDIIDQLVPAGVYEEIPAVLNEWYGGLVAGIKFPLPEDPACDGEVQRAVAALRSMP
jgi:probable F420-dependent oxidoreductase